MTLRDPKIDPVPGDVVRGKSGTLRTVIRTDFVGEPNPRIVFTTERNGAAPTRRAEWLPHWRRWCARNATETLATK